jgi:alcohol dehydrogenase class IV
MKDLANVLPGSSGNAIQGLNRLLSSLWVENSLKNCGLKEGDISKAAAIVVKAQYNNPRKLEEEKIRELIRRAWAGESARADL